MVFEQEKEPEFTLNLAEVLVDVSRRRAGYFGAYTWLDCKTVGFFLQISKEIGKAWRKSLTRAKRASLTRLSPVSLSVFSVVPDLLFDCSRLLEYAKIRTVLQSNTWQLLSFSAGHYGVPSRLFQRFANVMF